MADLYLLGVFEDAAQREFLSGLLETVVTARGWGLLLEPRKTDGCRYDFLREHLALAPHCNGVVIGVDGQKLGREGKIAAMRANLDLRQYGATPLLWSVASPSIEAWMMADPEALPATLAAAYGEVRDAPRPGHPNSERRAKQVLDEWVQALLGEELALGGREHALEVGRRLNPQRLAPSRNPDLLQLLDELPEFLVRCARNC